MDVKELIIVVGLSGAGKTTANRYFESAGYYTIDNLPINSLYEVMVDLNCNSKYLKYSISINTLLLTEDQVKAQLDRLGGLDWLKFKIVYLDVSKKELIKRYQLTRKKHPLTVLNESLEHAIKQEEEMLSIFKQFATIIIETTDLTVDEFRNKLKRSFDKMIDPRFIIDFVSFGYKHGIPNDLDYAFDVRFLPNPYYIPALKELTGNNKEVYNYVLKQPQTTEFLNILIPFLDYCIQQQKNTNRSYLVIGIGCTGGQHRSVTIANYLARHYEKSYSVLTDHRNAKKNT
ncbi:RNase adapter RapZ [Mycoplasma sp. P36-A1]|uniref:RNase adapter RapZ n=1 Tax=Mycoplasma sp. P36-A1 TaxID=3252900 RepID=UPI003C2B841B